MLAFSLQDVFKKSDGLVVRMVIHSSIMHAYKEAFTNK